MVNLIPTANANDLREVITRVHHLFVFWYFGVGLLVCVTSAFVCLIAASSFCGSFFVIRSPGSGTPLSPCKTWRPHRLDIRRLPPLNVEVLQTKINCRHKVPSQSSDWARPLSALFDSYYDSVKNLTRMSWLDCRATMNGAWRIQTMDFPFSELLV